MTEKKLPNEERNLETSNAIVALKSADHGALSIKPSGVAQSMASLNVAESLQMLQLEIRETATGTQKALAELQGQVSGASHVVSTTIENEVEKLITSNTDLATSNEYYAKWNKRLAITLIAVTLFVGLVQAYVIWGTAESNRNTVQIQKP